MTYRYHQEYRARQPLLPSRYERYVNHRLDDDSLSEAMTLGHPGLAHPDNCPDCAANPELGRKVHEATKWVDAAMDELDKFFVGPVDRLLLQNMFMSASLALQDAQAESYADERRN